MSSGFWAPFYQRILKQALESSLKNDRCSTKHQYRGMYYTPDPYITQAELDEWTHKILLTPAGVLIGGQPLIVDWSYGVWDEAIHIALLDHCWHLTLDDARQSLFRLAIRGLIKRKRWNPLEYDDCEPWPRWTAVHPLVALASV